MKKIAVLGSTNTGMVISGKGMPVPGETVSVGMGVCCGNCRKLQGRLRLRAEVERHFHMEAR